MPSPLTPLLHRARHVLGDNQEELARRVGSSKRTVQRWEVERSSPAPWHLHRLIDAVRPRDPELAAQLEVYAPRPAPPAPPAPEPAPAAVVTPALSALVSAVICAAAEAMNVPPQAIRPAVLAALVQARDTGLSLEQVISFLAPPEPPAEAKASKVARKTRDG